MRGKANRKRGQPTLSEKQPVPFSAPLKSAGASACNCEFANDINLKSNIFQRFGIQVPEQDRGTEKPNCSVISLEKYLKA